jgi:uncharacterized protein VirK/YbjX
VVCLVHACKYDKIVSVMHIQDESKFEKGKNHKLSKKIKYQLHYWIFDNKNFKTRSHLNFLIRIFN